MDWISGIFSNLWRPKKSGSTWFYPLAGTNLWNEVNCVDAFSEIPELNAVISLKARCFSSGIIKMVDMEGKEVNKPLPPVMEKPNWFQDMKEFMRQTKLFHEIHGNEYVYFLAPVGMPANTKAIYTIPCNIISQEYESNLPFWVWDKRPKELKYYIHDEGTKREIDPDTIIHMNDNKVTIKKPNDKTVFEGQSRMVGLRPAIKNIRMAYESRGVILKHRGALGILSNNTSDVAGGIPLEQKEIDKIQQQYQTNYGGLDGQYSTIITSANVRWQQMAVNPDKLGLFQETKEDFAKILDSYGVPPELFSEKDATFENKNQARKALYENTIIPEANEWIASFNDRFFPDGEIKMIVDYTHLPIFQDDMKKRSETLQIMVNALSALLADRQITPDEYRQELFKIGIGDGKAIPEPEQPAEAAQADPQAVGGTESTEEPTDEPND